MEGDFIQKTCCGATFGHRSTCVNYLGASKELPSLRYANAELFAKNTRLTAENVRLKAALAKAVEGLLVARTGGGHLAHKYLDEIKTIQEGK